MTSIDDLYVPGHSAAVGDRGERLHARTPSAQMKVWNFEAREPAGPHANAYDYLGYVAGGEMTVLPADLPPFTVTTGDSFAIPAGTAYDVSVKDSAVIVQVLVHE